MANNETMRPALMASENVQSLLVSVKYQITTTTGEGASAVTTSEFADIHDGALVVLGDLAANDPYNVGTRNGGTIDGYKDDNVYLAEAPAATTDDVVIVDLAEITQGSIAGNVYKMGIKLYGLVAEAGMPARARRLWKGDKFWLQSDCFTAAPTVGEYAIPTANDTHHTPSKTKAASGYCVKIQDARPFVTGNTVRDKLYLCEVV